VGRDVMKHGGGLIAFYRLGGGESIVEEERWRRPVVDYIKTFNFVKGRHCYGKRRGRGDVLALAQHSARGRRLEAAHGGADQSRATTSTTRGWR
jgi:hypothetical protein